MHDYGKFNLFSQIICLSLTLEKTSVLIEVSNKLLFFSELLVTDYRRQATFINGFSYWHDGYRKLKKHDESKCHIEAVNVIKSGSSTPKVNELLDRRVKQDKKDSHDMLTFVVNAIRHLGRQGLAIRGATVSFSNSNFAEPDSNLWQLLCTWSRMSPRLDELLKRTRTYASPEIQNELLSIMSRSVQRAVVDIINSSPWYSLMLDETPDVSGQEQLVICFRYVGYISFMFQFILLSPCKKYQNFNLFLIF